MSRSGRIRLNWGDGEHVFRLRIGELIELQEKCDAGPSHVMERLATNRWKVEDIREPIRLGLIGGGLDAGKALTLVKRYVDDFDRTPLQESVHFAYAIIGAAVVGAEDESLGKSEGEQEMNSQTSQEVNSGSPSSTESEQFSG